MLGSTGQCGPLIEGMEGARFLLSVPIRDWSRCYYPTSIWRADTTSGKHVKGSEDQTTREKDSTRVLSFHSSRPEDFICPWSWMAERADESDNAYYWGVHHPYLHIHMGGRILQSPPPPRPGVFVHAGGAYPHDEPIRGTYANDALLRSDGGREGRMNGRVVWIWPCLQCAFPPHWVSCAIRHIVTNHFKGRIDDLSIGPSGSSQPV
ncbi:hypothetical protein B0I35DRAFT_69106 [Stachybotrys elegans]|uniref:Uncharacterized protein n=1 Tax=Stachybotrys elegans TaxID=80388 RepID=A0A8K0WNQ6_9HYPO|nr:hypothetical protein B0I35DRAFT_69106 [Stachybotrys elegans]